LKTPTILDLAEFQLLKDHELYLRKRKLAEKITLLLTDCAEEIASVMAASTIFPIELATSRPKISTGENYLGFPWHTLDFPRYFKGDDIFAMRSLCWWGNQFIVTLHLSGIYAQQYRSPIFGSLDKIKDKGYFICINDQQWVHQLTPTNYCTVEEALQQVSKMQAISAEKGFIKIAKAFPLEEHAGFHQHCKDTLTDFITLLEASE
jgi:hypothetical protein